MVIESIRYDYEPSKLTTTNIDRTLTRIMFAMPKKQPRIPLKHRKTLVRKPRTSCAR